MPFEGFFSVHQSSSSCGLEQLSPDNRLVINVHDFKVCEFEFDFDSQMAHMV